MNNLQEITLKVPAEIAEFYSRSSEFEKKQIELKLTAMIQLNLNQTVANNHDRLGEIMDDISRKAQERGLTPEILEEILNEDD